MKNRTVITAPKVTGCAGTEQIQRPERFIIRSPAPVSAGTARITESALPQKKDGKLSGFPMRKWRRSSRLILISRNHRKFINGANAGPNCLSVTSDGTWKQTGSCSGGWRASGPKPPSRPPASISSEWSRYSAESAPLLRKYPRQGHFYRRKRGNHDQTLIVLCRKHPMSYKIVTFRHSDIKFSKKIVKEQLLLLFSKFLKI